MTEPILYSVPDISCEHCVNSITSEVTGVEGVTDIKVDLENKIVAVTGGEASAIVAAIDEAGYDVA